MILNDIFNASVFADVAVAPPLPDVANKNIWHVPLYDCVDSASYNMEGEYVKDGIKQDFHYGIDIEFEPGKIDAFWKERSTADGHLDRSTYKEVTSIIQGSMHEVLSAEVRRDSAALYGTGSEDSPDLNKEDILKNIEFKTLLETHEFILPEMTSLLQQTYPDSGIIGIELTDMRGAGNEYCGTNYTPLNLDDFTKPQDFIYAAEAPSPDQSLKI